MGMQKVIRDFADRADEEKSIIARVIDPGEATAQEIMEGLGSRFVLARRQDGKLDMFDLATDAEIGEAEIFVRKDGGFVICNEMKEGAENG